VLVRIGAHVSRKISSTKTGTTGRRPRRSATPFKRSVIFSNLNCAFVDAKLPESRSLLHFRRYRTAKSPQVLKRTSLAAIIIYERGKARVRDGKTGGATR
jgi:hypothetical protein